MENIIKEKFDISVILPIKSSSAFSFEEYFNKCIESIKNQKVEITELIIVHTKQTSLVEFLDSYDFSGINVVRHSWEGDGNYAGQVNVGARIAKSKWISLFEFDDEFSSIWFKNVKKYTEIYDNIDAFLPIVVDTDEKGLFAGFTNEATFALNMSSEIGFLTNETLQQFQNFQISGMVIKKESFLDYGLIKPSFKLTFGYEFLLRLTYNSVKIMTIPKIGYKHTNLRTGSIFWNYKNGEDKMVDDEVRFWIESAKKEYFFINDRAIKYEPTEI